MKNSEIFDLSEMLEAIQMMGFEPLEMDFFRRIETINEGNNSQLIMYCEIKDNEVELSVYEDAINVETLSNITNPLQFIDLVEEILANHNIASVQLSPIDSSITVNGKPIIAADNFTTKDFMKKIIRVKSSNIWGYAFQPKDYNKGNMLIQFKGANGGPDDIYIYYDVPSKLWQKFVAAPSKGHFMWQHIRNVFKYGKLTGDKRTKLPNGV